VFVWNIRKNPSTVLCLLSLLVLGSCVDSTGGGSSGGSNISGGGLLGHGGGVSEGFLSGGASEVKKPKGWPDRGHAVAQLSADRCHGGKMTFGPVDGKYYECPTLGRGVTRWGDRWQSGPPAKHSLNCMGGRVSTVASDWQKGSNSAGQTCYFLKDHKRCGATPVGNYRVTGSFSSKVQWGGKGASIQPQFRTSRSSFLVHSDNRFDASTAAVDNPTHSSAGCLKLAPGCQQLFNRYSEQNSGSTLEVKQ